jgi:hypothetical protein
VFNNLAVLIAAIAGLIGSLTSFVGMIVVVRRTSPRERRDAAESAAEKVLMPAQPLLDIANAVVDLKESQRERGEDDESGNVRRDKRSRRRRSR